MTIVNTLRQRIRTNKLADHLIKEASSDAGKAFLYTMGGGLASAGVAYGVPAALEAVQGARVRASKDKLIAKMRSAHPELKNYSRRDMDLVYNSLAMHAPRVLKDPLVGGQIMLESLRRGNHMDLGQLGNVSKMTGGSGITEHQRDAAQIFAQQMGRATENYAKDRFDSRVSDTIKIERVKGEINKDRDRAKSISDAKANYAQSRAKARYTKPKGTETKAQKHTRLQDSYTARAKYRAYKKAKRT